jgi:MFS transporter, Spinster family, sphingosine-1-phosphate transporter
MTANATTTAAPGPVQAALPGARTALLLLLAINLFNYIDRQVLAAVEPEIRRELLPQLSDKGARFWMGLLSTAFLVTYMLTAPLFGWLADRASRWVLVGIGVVLWSLASGASGLDWHTDLTTAFWLLLLTRCFVGIGEGAYGPVAPTMISDLYPVKDRGRVLAWFYLAIPVGGALGYAFGEIIQRTWGWRWAFYLVVPPGLLLGVWCFLMREPPRGEADHAVKPHRKAALKDYLALFRIPSYTLNTLGMTAMTFAIGALAWWMPDYLEEQRVPDMFGIGPRTVFGAITALSGLIATLLGGMAGDWLRGRYPGSYFLVSACAMMLGFPMLLLFLYVPFPWAWIFVFLTVFCLFFNTGPTNTILANVTHPSVRASGFALNILIIHLFGDAISPPVIGFIADLSSMAVGFAVVSVMMLAGGLLWLWGARYLERDTALAPTRLAPDATPSEPRSSGSG